jgi:thermitase
MQHHLREPSGRFPHKARFWLVPALFVFTLCALLSLAVTGLAQDVPPGYAKGHVLVKFREGLTDQQRGQAIASIRAKGLHLLGNLKVHSVDLLPGQEEKDAVARLQRRSEVEFAELDQVVSAAGIVVANDPGLPNQWFLPNISAPDAWNLTTGSPNVIVAILDTGCEPNHPDLLPNYVPGWNFYNNNSDTSDPNGHGTAVAGCVGASGNNSLGIASVSWNSKIMPVRIADANGYAYWSTVAQGMQWAVDHGAKIENCSYVGLAGSSTIQNAAQYVFSHGGLFVACAGNDAIDPGFTANSNILIVSGTDESNNRAYFSDYGNFVTVSAPATNIYTTQTAALGYYATWAGTSFAAPQTCGVLALEWAANPALTNAQVRSVLLQSVDDLGNPGWDAYFGYGKINALRAVQMALAQATTPVATDTTPPTVSLAAPLSGATVSGSISVQANASDDTGVASVTFSVDGVSQGIASAAPYNFSWNTASVANGSHTLKVMASDAAGNTASAQISVTVSNGPLDTSPPTVSIASQAGSKTSTSITVNATASDNVGVMKVELWVDGKLSQTRTTSPWSFSVSTRKWATGPHTLQCKAYDAAGNVGLSQIVTVTK